MSRLLTAILFLLVLPAAKAQFRGVIINEFSQGDQGSREYIELLVVGHRTCSDSTADIRGWIVDDQNGWYGTTNGSDGHYRFKDIPQWASVPFGSIILLYNNVVNQKNLSIVLPDDPTDANKDYAYILPINSSAFLEEHDNTPNLGTPSATYIYPSANIITGYGPATNQWIQHIALNNTGGDVLSIVNRAKRDSAFFSVGYGYTIATGFRQPTVSISNVGTATNAALIDSAYHLGANWQIATVPLSETPGLPNGGVNSAWIIAMRTTPLAAHTYTTVCTDNPYLFLGQIFTTTGLYTVLHNSVHGCVDTADLYLVIKRSELVDTTACDSIIYNGIKYTNDNVVMDTIRSVLTNCDSVVQTVRIHVSKSSLSLTKVCVGIGQSYSFNGQTFYNTGLYSVTLTNAQGCDSIAYLYLTKTLLDSNAITRCGSAVYGGQIFTTSTILYDTVKSVVTGCDSLLRKTTIVINQPTSTSLSICGINGTPYNYNGTLITASGLYTFHFLTKAGCDSTVQLYIVFRSDSSTVITACDSVSHQNKWYFATATISDTIKSSVSNCDSLLLFTHLIIHKTSFTQINACVPTGGSYSFFGQSLTLSGNYTHSLQTISGCDSIVRLRLTVTQLLMQRHRGCDSVRFNGQVFYNATQIFDTVRNQFGCDSLIRIDSVIVTRMLHRYITVCLSPGQTYSFNGQMLNTSGIYQTTYSSTPCDSIVHLYLTVAIQQSVILRHCRVVVYNGVTYTSSTSFIDTVKNITGNCDSVYRNIQILIQPLPQTYITTCREQGATYSFNGQVLSATGHYTTTYRTLSGCDSIVNLYLVISSIQSQTLTGCESVIYRGTVYTTSTMISDTVRSSVSSCDSLIRSVSIIVYKKPQLIVSSNTILCRGDTLTLTASAPGTVINWIGLGTGNAVIVAPQATTQYAVSATDTNGCTAKATMTVSVQDFQLTLHANSTAVLSGNSVHLRSNSNLPCTILAWQPASIFSNQTATSQAFVIDTSVIVGVVGKTLAGCYDTALLQLSAIPFDNVYIPSGFTPNNDGRNEEVRVMGSGIDVLDLKIFNRWGQMLFHTTDKNKGWNGKTAGVFQPAGTYVYVVKAKKRNGQIIEKKGTVVLIR